MRQYSRPASVMVLMLFLATLAAYPSVASPSLRELQQQLARKTRDINSVRAKLRPIKQKQKNAAHQLAVAQHRLEITRMNHRDIQAQLRDTRNKLAATRAELEKINKRLKKTNDLLAGRLVDTYKHGSISYLSILLGAADFWDLLNRGYIVRNILETDAELLQTIRKDRQAIEEHKAILEEQERKRADLERQQRELASIAYTQTVECQQMLSEIQRDRAKYEQMLAELEATSRRIGAMIRKMQMTPQGRSHFAQVWKGGFIAPVNGRISSAFGMRYHPILRIRSFHTGTDFACPYGTPIRASAGGIVEYAGWYGAYGYTVMINHGGGLWTIYGHCSRLAARAGAKVNQGEIIGYVGSTGLSTGPHLHFEVQRNGVPQPPPF